MNPKDKAALDRVPLHLLPAIGQVWGAMAVRDGAMKYGPYNWREKPISLMTYLGAMERHILAMRDGEDNAPDSEVHHLGHIIATASIILDAQEAGKLIDDRPDVLVDTAQIMKDLETEMKAGHYDSTKDSSDGNGTGTEHLAQGTPVSDAEKLDWIPPRRADGTD